MVDGPLIGMSNTHFSAVCYAGWQGISPPPLVHYPCVFSVCVLSNVGRKQRTRVVVHTWRRGDWRERRCCGRPV